MIIHSYIHIQYYNFITLEKSPKVQTISARQCEDRALIASIYPLGDNSIRYYHLSSLSAISAEVLSGSSPSLLLGVDEPPPETANTYSKVSNPDGNCLISI